MFIMPSDFTFTSDGELVHKDTYQRLQKLFEQAEKRDPDLHEMSVYNDYYGYAILNLVDKTLSSIHSAVQKKEWFDAWRLLDALTLFNEVEGVEWTDVDDGDRVAATECALGAMLITTIRALDDDCLFKEHFIPDLEQALKRMAEWAADNEDLCDTCYTAVLHGYGKVLFGDRTVEQRKRLRLEKEAAYREFVRGLSEEERSKRSDYVSSQSGRRAEQRSSRVDKAWFGKAKPDDAYIVDDSFRVYTMWKEYKEIWSSVPHLPAYGLKSWDITKWSAADKDRFCTNRGPTADEILAALGFSPF